MPDASRDETAPPASRTTGDIFVISDLHLGDGGVRDNFEPGDRTRQLHTFLDHVGAEGGELFILGDLFELWQMNTSRIFTHRRPLLDHLARLPVVYVPGNHDVDLLHFIDSGFLQHPFFACMRRPFDRQLGGRRFRFFHGHETDPFNSSENPGFGQMLSIFAGLFEDRNQSPLLASGEVLEAVLEQFGDSMLALWTAASVEVSARVGLDTDVEPQHSLTPAQKPDRLTEHLESIQAARAREGWDVAVVGHTHKPGRVDDWYHNSGSWSGAANTFLRIDPEGRVRYFEWKEDRAVEQEEPLVRPERKERHPLKKATENVRLLFPQQPRQQRSRALISGHGLLALALGVWAFFTLFADGRNAALSLLFTAFGWYTLVTGAFSFLGAARRHSIRRILSRVTGSLSIILGLVLLTHRESLEVFAVIVGVWALVTGGLRTAAAALFRGAIDARRLWVVGVASLLAGLILLFLPPSALLLTDVIAGYLCFIGGDELLAGIIGRPLGSRSRRFFSKKARRASVG